MAKSSASSAIRPNDLEGSAADWYTQVGGTDQIEDAYLTSVISMAGMAVAIYVVKMLVRMSGEEAEGHLEPLLAAAISRPRWVMSHVLHAALGAVALLLVFALTMGIGSGAALGDTPGQLAAATETSLAQLPAILVIGACVIAAIGLLPRWAGALSWTIVALSILLGPLFGPTVDLPQWAQDLSPFTHIPKLPAAALTVTPILALTAIAAALALAGVSAFRRRSLALPT